MRNEFAKWEIKTSMFSGRKSRVGNCWLAGDQDILIRVVTQHLKTRFAVMREAILVLPMHPYHHIPGSMVPGQMHQPKVAVRIL